jgi:AcrR family transcriptional regulator
VRLVGEGFVTTGHVGRPGNDLESLLAAAFRVFRERGYDATSVEMIAKAAGITKSGVYHHVRTKEELLERGVDRIQERINAVLEEPDAKTGSPGERLRFIVGRAVEVELEMLDETAVFLRLRGNTKVEKRIVQRRRDFDRRIAALVAAAAESGEVRADLDPLLVSRLTFGMTNSVADWFDSARQLQPAELANAVRTLLFDGLSGAQCAPVACD